MAIFDLDYTLLCGDSDHAWGQFLVEQHIVDGEIYRRENDRYYAEYQAGTLDIHQYLAFALHPLSQHDQATLAAWHRQFMQSKIRPMITPAARALVDKHRQRSDTLLIITSTNRFVTAPIARAFGIDNLLATEPEIVDGRFTGRVTGTPCFREGKLARLKDWLATRSESLDDSWCYSDSHNDLPLLQIAHHPIAVNPDATLAEEARARGWPILMLH